MIKHAVCVLAVTTLLVGCAGSQYQSIPVVDNGSPLSPGAMRDSRARQTVTTVDMNQQTHASSQPAGDDAVETYAVPSSPISGIQVHHADSPASAPSMAAPSVSASVAAQARLAADEQLAGPVLALLTSAKQQQSGGDFNGAASSLERAQRIAPREPQVLYRLAEVRLAQGDASQAEQLAQQGLRYSEGRSALQAGLWDLIARARTAQGNTAGAQEAHQRARVNL